MHTKNPVVSIGFTSIFLAAWLSGCTTIMVSRKIASIPLKLMTKTGEQAGKGVYATGKTVGKAVGNGAFQTAYHTGMFAGKTAQFTGNTAYNAAKVPVHVSRAALDSSAKLLTVTTRVVDSSGDVVSVSRTLQKSEVDGYVSQAQGAANIVSVLVDVYQG